MKTFEFRQNNKNYWIQAETLQKAKEIFTKTFKGCIKALQYPIIEIPKNFNISGSGR